ncbi:cytochrome P450 [Nocardioides plantarum]|uniref:Cytochrome P450 n=1 Tax=Nocardioides plantarum TaxID=29299 RepID=A0ABV5K8A9_9ACTN|nr:cytochrome P450 [Nocardioides plantarum]
MTSTLPATEIPTVSIAVPDEDGHGHLAELRTDPVALLERVHAECGPIGRFRIADKEVIMVTGAEANEQFFKAPESTLDQAAAYPFMTPIFGHGVVFDASPEERQQALKNQALRGDQMRGHATTIENEINRMVAEWGDEGEVDLLDFFAELTIYNTAACLVGLPFREEIDHRFAEAYHGLERGTDALAYVDPYLEGVESFEIRDRSRATLVSLVQDIIDRRVSTGSTTDRRHVPKDERDLLDVLISLDMSADYITGVFISMLFAGHHTSSGTSAWTLIELMRHPEIMTGVVAELDDLYADRHEEGHREISFRSLRSIPQLESVIKETLRLHPPLIILMRQVVEEMELAGHTIPVGTIVASSPRVSNRLEEDFPDAQSFDPTRYQDPRQEDMQNRWTWIPFGAGKHRCVGNAFAMMQIKAIFSVLLRDFEFELVQPAETYRDDYSKMVIQLQRPCRARYRRRQR